MNRRVPTRILAIMLLSPLIFVTLAQEPLALTQTHEIAGLGFSIDYPAGWFADSQAPATLISQLEVDHEQAFSDSDSPQVGIVIAFDHRDIDFMRSIGLPADATMTDLVQLNAGFFEWQEPFEVVDTEVFGVPAASVRTVDDNGFSTVTLQGFIGEEMFLLSIVAPPPGEVLDDFLPTWEAMLASIEPIVGE